MQSDWPADAEQMRAAIAPHETGSGPFVFTTRTWIQPDVEFRCVHRFHTAEGRAAYRRVVEPFGIFLSEENP